MKKVLFLSTCLLGLALFLNSCNKNNGVHAHKKKGPISGKAHGKIGEHR